MGHRIWKPLWPWSHRRCRWHRSHRLHPHIYPGLYENNGPAIRQAVTELQRRLAEADIPLQLTYGADTHIARDLEDGLRGRVPSLHGSRYFCWSRHHRSAAAPGEIVFNLLVAGYVPVITHPERLSWIEDHYGTFVELVRKGAWLQVTAGSLTGRFGSTAQYWGERLLDEGWVHSGHRFAQCKTAATVTAEGQCAAERWWAREEAVHLVGTRPKGILTTSSRDRMPKLPIGFERIMDAIAKGDAR